MVRLQELLSQSVQQTLGLSDVLNRREREAGQLGQTLQAAGQIEVAGEVQKIEEKKASKFSLFNTIGTVLGAVGGAALAGPGGALAGLGTLGAASTGAGVGAGIGEFVSGEQRQKGQVTGGDIITKGLEFGSELEQTVTKRLLSAKPKGSFKNVFNPETKKEEIAFITQPSAGVASTITFTGAEPVPEKSLNELILEADKLVRAKTKAGEAAKEEATKLSLQTAFAPLFAIAEQVEPRGLAGVGQFLAGVAKLDPAAESLEALRKQLAPLVAKKIAKDAGNIAEGERAAAMSILPSPFDSKKGRATKVAILRSIINPDITPEESRKAIFTALGVATKDSGVKDNKKITAVSQTSDGKIRLSDGRVVTKEEATRIIKGGS